MFTKLITKFIGTKNDRTLKQLGKVVNQINALEAEYEQLNDEQLQAKTDDGLCPHGAKRIDCAACDRDSDIAYDAAREDRFFGRSRGRD